MNSNADVKRYIDGQPDEWRPALKRLRTACRKQLLGYTEVFEYGMPGYQRGGTAEIGFAKQARYLSFYVLKKPVLDANRGRLISSGNHYQNFIDCVKSRAADKLIADIEKRKRLTMVTVAVAKPRPIAAEKTEVAAAVVSIATMSARA